MKLQKICALLLALLFLTGCGRQSAVLAGDPEKETPAAEEAAPEAAEPTAAEEPSEDWAVWIPALELPEPEPGVVYDMIGLIVWHGGIYTQAQFYYGEEAEALDALVGEELGYATGSIDEWSRQDEYAVECASTMAGPFYAMEGYDTDFRLCMKGVYEGGEAYLWTFERLNGIGLNTGGDLFGDRLRIRENWTSASFLTHDDWNDGEPNHEQPLEVSEADFNSFLDAVYAGEFVYVYEDTPDFYTRDSAPQQAHLYVHLSDGTTAALRLFEGGYVGYEPLGWYFVRIPEDDPVFQRILDACG